MVPVPAPIQDPDPVPGPVQTIFSTVFQERKNGTKSCLFFVRSSLFPRKLASHFSFFKTFLLHFMLDPDPNLVPEPDPEPEP